MEVFAARFPIFDRKKSVYGYELAPRGSWRHYHGAIASTPPAPEQAGLRIDKLLGGRRGFLTFDRESLLDGIHRDFSPDSTVIRLEAATGIDEPLLEACRAARDQGFQLALAGLDEPNLGSPILPLASIVDVNFPEVPADRRKRICGHLNARGIEPLASQLQSEAEFDNAQEDGFTLFGGVFYQTPNIELDTDKLSPNQLIALQLLKEVSRPDVAAEDLAGLIQRDVALTYQLLRLVNSVWFGLRYEVTSIRHALVCLGPREVQRWATTMTMALVGGEKPDALLELALTRAKFAESLAVLAGRGARAPESFLVGMFSLLDAITDRPMEEVLADIALSADIKQALQGRPSDCLPIYKAMLAYECGQWVLFTDLAREVGIDADRVPPLYRGALEWSRQAQALMAG